MAAIAGAQRKQSRLQSNISPHGVQNGKAARWARVTHRQDLTAKRGPAVDRGCQHVALRGAHAAACRICNGRGGQASEGARRPCSGSCCANSKDSALHASGVGRKMEISLRTLADPQYENPPVLGDYANANGHYNAASWDTPIPEAGQEARQCQFIFSDFCSSRLCGSCPSRRSSGLPTSAGLMHTWPFSPSLVRYSAFGCWPLVHGHSRQSWSARTQVRDWARQRSPVPPIGLDLLEETAWRGRPCGRARCC